jgi:oxalate decarboxylase
MVQIADSHNFKAAINIAAALVTVHASGMREMHWHPNADVWQYYVKGSAQIGVQYGAGGGDQQFQPG